MLLDAYALIGLLAGEPVAAEVTALSERETLSIAVVNLGEVIDRLQRVHEFAPDEVRSTIAPLVAAGLRLRPVRAEDGWKAGELRARYYDKKTCAISLADAFLLAAVRRDERIATSDPAVIAVAEAEGISTSPLPDRAGRRP